MNLFESPIQAVKIRRNTIAYKYMNSNISINGIKYIGYSMTEAIKRYRKNYPIKKR